MKLLFIGYAMPKCFCNKYKGSSIAGNKMQLGVLKGLKKSLGNKIIDVITIPSMAPYPQFKKIFVTSKKMKLLEGINAQFIPFINLPFIKQVMQVFFTFVYALKWVVRCYNYKEKVVLCYNSYPNVALAARVLKKIFKCKIICLFADPPIDVSSRRGVAKITWKLYEKIAEKSIKQFDGIIALNKLAITDYAPNVPYIVLDGGFDPDDHTLCITDKQAQEKIEKIIMFSGMLIEYNGIKTLVEGFKLIGNPLYKLWIFGDGPLRQYVESESKKDPRIIYKGTAPNKEIIVYQKKADILVNPRLTKSSVSKYTFPSKLIEYMLSGTPVITTRVNGITEDYYPYLYFFDEETPEAFAQKISEILALDQEERRNKGIAAREYIIKNKNWDIQCQKMVKFISDISVKTP